MLKHHPKLKREFWYSEILSKLAGRSVFTTRFIKEFQRVITKDLIEELEKKEIEDLLAKINRKGKF